MIQKYLNISRISSGTKNWKIETTSGTYETKCIINAAGVYADRFHNMVSEKKIHIIPRKGEYCLLDKSVGSHVSHTVLHSRENLAKVFWLRLLFMEIC